MLSLIKDHTTTEFYIPVGIASRNTPYYTMSLDKVVIIVVVVVSQSEERLSAAAQRLAPQKV